MSKMKIVINKPESCVKCILFDKVCFPKIRPIEGVNLESAIHPECPMVPNSKPGDMEDAADRIKDLLDEFETISDQISNLKIALNEACHDVADSIDLITDFHNWERKIFNLELSKGENDS